MKRFAGLLNRSKSRQLIAKLPSCHTILTLAHRQRLQHFPRRVFCTCRLARSKCCSQYSAVLRISFRCEPRRRSPSSSSDRRSCRILARRRICRCPTDQALPQQGLCHKASRAVQCNHADSHPERQPWTYIHTLLRPELRQDCERVVKRMQGSWHAADFEGSFRLVRG
jgi:hypothetical protein